FGGVLALVTGSVTGRRDRRNTHTFVLGHVISTLVNMTAAVTLTAAFRWSPWTLVLGVVLVVGSYLGGRASADARIDRMRLEAMQRATHALAAGLNLSE